MSLALTPANEIPVQQNTAASLQLLSASSQVYREASHLQMLQFALTVIAPLLGAVTGVLLADARPYVAAAALAITILDVGLIDRAQRRRLKLAARMREEFDTEVLRMPWNPFAAGKRVEPEAIAEAARKWPDGNAALRDWYPITVRFAPLHLARVVCQRANLWYDAKLRERYSFLLLLGAAVLAVTLAAAGLVAGLSWSDFVATILTPAAPLLIWTLRDFYRQHDAAEALRTARSEAEALWELVLADGCDDDECARRSREFQNTLFARRAANPLLFPGIYSRTRPAMDAQMNAGAEALLRQAGVALPLQAGTPS